MNPAVARLSRRERECIDLAVEGHDTKEIARELGLSTETVKGYFKSAYGKLGVTRRSQLVRLFRAPPDRGNQSGGMVNPGADRLSDEPPGRTVSAPEVLREAPAAFVHEPPERARPVEPEDAPDDLTPSPTQTIGVLFKLALLALAALLLFMAVMREARDLGWPLFPYLFVD